MKALKFLDSSRKSTPKSDFWIWIGNIQTPNRFLCQQKVQLIRSVKIFLGRQGHTEHRGLRENVVCPVWWLTLRQWEHQYESPLWGAAVHPAKEEETKEEEEQWLGSAPSLKTDDKRKKGEADNKHRITLMRTLSCALMSSQHKLSLDINVWIYSAFQFRLPCIIRLITYSICAR